MKPKPHKLFGGTLHSALVHAATAYDRTQSNPYALGQILQRLDEVEADIARGATPRAALCAAFHDRLLDRLLVAIGEPKHTRDELGTAITYHPVTPNR